MACNLNNTATFTPGAHDPNCMPTPTPSESSHPTPGPLGRDLPCDDRTDDSESTRTKVAYAADPGSSEVASQTRKDTASNTINPNSFERMTVTQLKEPLQACKDDHASRNPITGCGLNGDGVGGLKPKKPKARADGNPVTGEGYKPVEYNQNPSVNGANQVINKNRIPPGGYSSGLW